MKEQTIKNYIIAVSIAMIISSCSALTSIGNDQSSKFDNSKDIFESDEIIKTSTNIENNLINIEVPFREIYNIYKSKCSKSSIDKANTQIESMKNLWGNSSKAENRSLDLNNKYIKIQDMLSAVKQEDEDNFCTQKYLLYHMLEEVQKQYVQETKAKLMKYTKLQDSSNNPQKTEVKIHSAPTPIKYVNLVNRTKDLSEEDLDYANLADEYIQKEI